MDISGKLKRAAAVGVVASVATQLIYGPVGNANVFGISVPVSMAVGASAGAGSVAADVLHEWVPSTGFGDMGATAVELGAAGLVTGQVMDMVGVANGIGLQELAIGAGSLLGGRALLNSIGMGGGYIY